jgi:hypothetical protein
MKYEKPTVSVLGNAADLTMTSSTYKQHASDDGQNMNCIDPGPCPLAEADD